ncbi:MAG TPA: glycosyltransferase family 2 protein [Moraxellaceae bacterium]|nr:glycosyltransferase family 2 protein [Moraxellaceae bacterium]
MNTLHIVISDFNGFARTRRCLQALDASEFRQFTVIVVDHGTSEDTRIGLMREFPTVVRVAAPAELWWAGAMNCGIRYALDHGADAVILLNNDCYVERDALGELVRQAGQKPGAIIAPVQRDWQSGKVLVLAPGSCFLLGFPTLRGDCQLTPELRERGAIPVRLIVGGRGVLIPAAVLRSVGEFDEVRLPHYGADHDFYLRARRQGVRLYTATRALVNMDNTSTTLAEDPSVLGVSAFLQTLKSPRSHRNWNDAVALFRKHYPIPPLYLLGVVLFTGRYVLGYVIRRVLFLVRKRLA